MCEEPARPGKGHPDPHPLIRYLGSTRTAPPDRGIRSEYEIPGFPAKRRVVRSWTGLVPGVTTRRARDFGPTGGGRRSFGSVASRLSVLARARHPSQGSFLEPEPPRASARGRPGRLAVYRDLLELGPAEVVGMDLQIPAGDGEDDVTGLTDALPILILSRT